MVLWILKTLTVFPLKRLLENLRTSVGESSVDGTQACFIKETLSRVTKYFQGNELCDSVIHTTSILAPSVFTARPRDTETQR